MNFLIIAVIAAYEAANPLWGTEAVATPPSEGIARNWNWEKAQTGNACPGAVLPFGWVSVCAYSGAYSSGYGCSGISSDGPTPIVFNRHYARGFTHFHQSGTGWIGHFYNYFLFTPSANGVDTTKLSRLDDEVVKPGYYAGKLTDYKTAFELTSRYCAAAHRYQFPPNGGKILVDITQAGIGEEPLKLLNRKRERIDAYAINEVAPQAWAGWINAYGWIIHFAIIANGDCGEATCDNGRLTIPVKSSRVETYIGFSLVSIDEAKTRAKAACNAGFDRSRDEATKLWCEQLGKVRVKFADNERNRLFYSTLYHSLTKPVDCGKGYTDFSTFWDVYKTELPLIFALDRQHGRAMLEHIMATTASKGFSPICQIMENKIVHKDAQATALPLFTLCDGFFRGVLTREDYPRIKRTMEREFAHADISGMSPTHALDLAGAYGAGAFIAEVCGDAEYAKVLREKCAIWKGAYDSSTGLLIEKAPYYEGNHWNYAFRPHPGMNERVALAGGPQQFVKLLDNFFGYGQVNAEWTAANDRVRRVNHFEGLNNESDMESPFAYIWGGRVDRTAEIVDLVRCCRFANGAGGCPGNNDSGGTSSWYVWNSLGIFPVTGTPYYLLASPSVDSAEIDFAEGTLRIVVERESPTSIYPSGYIFNGRRFREPWLKVVELERGGTLTFKLKNNPQPASPIPNWL